MSQPHDDVDYQQLADAQRAAAAFAAGDLTYDFAAPAPELPPVPAGEPMVVFTLRVPIDTYQAIQVEAERRGVKASVVGREWLEQQRAEADPDEGTVRLADLRRVLAALPRAS